MITIGIDAGLDGAIVQLDGRDGEYKLFRMPTERYAVHLGARQATARTKAQPAREGERRRYDLVAISRLLRGLVEKSDDESVVVALERVHSLPKGGHQANFYRGEARGFLWMLVVLGFRDIEGSPPGHRLRYCTPLPQQWQAEMLRDFKGDDTKERALAAARHLWPTMPVEALRVSPRGTRAHDGIVDALLLAEFARWKVLGSVLESERRGA